MLPKGWKLKNLESCLEGSSDRNSGKKLGYEDLRAVNKTHGMIPMREQVKGNNLERCKIVQKDWFAYNPMRINVGSICRWKEAYPCIVSPDYVVFHCKPQLLDTDFFDHFRKSHTWNLFMENAGAGSVRIRIYLDDLGKIKIALPSVEEQQAIAKILSKWDEAAGKLRSLLAYKKQQKKALTKKLFSITAPVKKISDFTDCTAGGTPDTKKKEYWGGHIKWMNSGELNLKYVTDVQGRITEQGLKESSTKIIPQNCILIGLAGQGKTRGTVALNAVPLAINQSIAAIFPSPEFIPEYLYHNLNSRYLELRSLSTGDGGRGGLNLKIIRSIKVPLPSVNEQKRIAAILSSADNEIEKLAQKLEAYKQQKKALTQQLLTGKKRVNFKNKEAA